LFPWAAGAAEVSVLKDQRLKPQTVHFFDQAYPADFWSHYDLNKPLGETSGGLLVATPRRSASCDLSRPERGADSRAAQSHALLADYMRETIHRDPNVDLMQASGNVEAFNGQFRHNYALTLPHPCHYHPNGIVAQWQLLVEEMETVRHQSHAQNANLERHDSAILFDSRPPVLDATYLAEATAMHDAESARLHAQYVKLVLPMKTVSVQLDTLREAQSRGLLAQFSPAHLQALHTGMLQLQADLRALLLATSSERHQLRGTWDRAVAARRQLRQYLEAPQETARAYQHGVQNVFHVGSLQWTTQAKAQEYKSLCDRMMHNTMVLRRAHVRPHRLQLETALADLSHLLETIVLSGPGPVPVSTTF
jgi:hypothetical protein